MPLGFYDAVQKGGGGRKVRAQDSQGGCCDCGGIIGCVFGDIKYITRHHDWIGSKSVVLGDKKA